MENLAGAYRIIECALHFLDGGCEIPPMNEIEVDIIDPKPLEAGVERACQALAMHAGGVGVAAAGSGIGIFARAHKAVAVGLAQPPDAALPFASGIHVRRS